VSDTKPPLCTIWVDGHPKGPNGGGTLRSRIRDKMYYRDTVAWLCREYWSSIPAPLGRVRVVCTLVRVGGLPKDQDNAYSSLKGAIDGLTAKHGGSLLIDDAPDHLDLDVRQEKGQKRGVRIEIWDASDEQKGAA